MPSKLDFYVHFHTRAAGNFNWMSYFFSNYPMRPFADSLVSALMVCEERLEGLGFKLLDELMDVKYVRGDTASYEQFVQKLAEVVCVRTFLAIDWPDGTMIEHEPRAPNGKRPELRIETSEDIFLVEVKCPRLISHQWQRGASGIQLVSRVLPNGGMKAVAKSLFAENPLLPKDNNLKDFLISCEEKFNSFPSPKPCFGILCVIWDDHMYEAISPLTHKMCGLLTQESWLVDDDGNIARFPSVDGVMVINHFGVLTAASREEPARHRSDPFVIVDENHESNVWCKSNWGKDIPKFILKAFDAYPDEAYEGIDASKGKSEIIFWLSQ